MVAAVFAISSFVLLHLRVISAFTVSSITPRVCSQNQVITRNMCGIVAVLADVCNHANPSQVILPDITEHTARIHHRGPDGMHIDEINTQFRLGHTRLAIVDPSHNGDQPFALTDEKNNKKYHWAVNGEIYNHQDIYQDLVKEGWKHERISGSDCEVVGHAYAKHGVDCVDLFDGMFGFVVVEEDTTTGHIVNAMAARDPVGIKPLYYGRRKDSSYYVFASELKALVGLVEPSSVVAIPPGHYWTPSTGLVRYYNPEWLRNDDYAPWQDDPDHKVTDDEIRAAFTKAVQKRMMADVTYGFFLSGGIDSCVLAHTLLPLYRAEREKLGNYEPIHTYTVGMEDSPDVMAAKGMVEALGGSKYIKHHVRTFTPDEVFDLIPKIIYHMETYEAELIRSAIPNWLLAERASQDVKMVLTGEGADELFAGYLYFQDAKNSRQVQDELRRIYSMLGNVNLHRTDRMTMAHSLEARVPFLDTEFTRLIMSVDPGRKMVDREAVATNSRGREKTLLREMFEGKNGNGDSIPRPVLWRAKAMQCEGVGEDWVTILQQRIAKLVTDDEMANAAATYPINTPHTKEELYYRKIYDQHFHGMEHVVKLWEGGGRAMGAAWKSDVYTREGLKDTNLLSHSLQKKASGLSNGESLASQVAKEACMTAKQSGYNDFEALLTSGGDDRSMIKEATGSNKYHIRPKPIDPTDIFRGSCTGNPPSTRGYAAARNLYDSVFAGRQDEELDSALRNVFQNQRERIAKLLDLPEGAEVVLCPSGSDAEYIPVAIARTIVGPDAKITNGVTQLREIGAGSAPASVGKFFSTHAPLAGRIAGERKHLAGFEDIDGTAISARKRDGTVVTASNEMNQFVQSAFEREHYPIVHGVFGGKTGLRDEFMPPSLEGGAKSLGVVDACQGRFTLTELHEWLSQDSLVLFTASKFWQAPPFCGAVIIPPTIADKLRGMEIIRNDKMLSTDGLGGFLSDKELPPCLDCWKAFLPKKDSCNVGLALRWEAGLVGMEALAPISDDQRTRAVSEWADAVVDMVHSEALLDPWCVERSIVSIRVASENDGWLNMSELRDLYRWMSMDVSSAIPNATAEEQLALSKKAYIGQPVDVSEAHAIVRLALGAESLLSYINDKDKTLEEDRLSLKKMAAIAKHFATLKESGV